MAVTATEPDPAMLAELRAHVPSTVTTSRAAFEDLPPEAAFDLVFAAAALHWTRPEQRWERVAGMLAPHGVFASFGGPVRLAERELDAAVVKARSPFLADDEVPSPDGTPSDEAMQWPGTELRLSPLFDDVQQLVIERRLRLSAEDYVGHLSTVSAYLELPDAIRDEVFVRILDVLPSQVDLVADITLHLARRAGSGSSGATV